MTDGGTNREEEEAEESQERRDRRSQDGERDGTNVGYVEGQLEKKNVEGEGGGDHVRYVNVTGKK